MTNKATPQDVREHFNHDGPVVIIDAGRRSTAAWVRERWDGHYLGAEATVWDTREVAIAASKGAVEKILEEAPEHWVQHADQGVTA